MAATMIDPYGVREYFLSRARDAENSISTSYIFDPHVLRLVPNPQQNQDPHRERAPSIVHRWLGFPTQEEDLDFVQTRTVSGEKLSLRFRVNDSTARGRIEETRIRVYCAVGYGDGHDDISAEYDSTFTQVSMEAVEREPHTAITDEYEYITTREWPRKKKGSKGRKWYIYMVEVDIGEARVKYRSGACVVSQQSYRRKFVLSPRMFYIHHLALCRWIPDQPAEIRKQNLLPYQVNTAYRSVFLKGGEIWYWLDRRKLDNPDVLSDIQSASIPGDAVQSFWTRENSEQHMAWWLSRPGPLPDDYFVAAHRNSQWIDLHCDFYAPPGKYYLEISLCEPKKSTWESAWRIPESLHDHLSDLTGVQVLFGKAAPYQAWQKDYNVEEWAALLAQGKVDYRHTGGIYPITREDCEIMRGQGLSSSSCSSYNIRPKTPLIVENGSILQRVSMFTGSNEARGGPKGILRTPFVFGGIRLSRIWDRVVDRESP